MGFRHLVGHRQILGLLARAVARETLPPSLIFAGPEGVGKRRTAVALAQVLNCPTPLKPAVGIEVPDLAEPRATPFEIDACDTCTSCRRIARLVHADVLTIEPGETGSIKIDQVRDAIDRSAYRPFEGRRRVVIVDQADRMGEEAQNALLKTLEEPPAASTFVLVSSRSDLLLPTVRSRCPRLRFGPLGAGEVGAILIESHGVNPVEARALAAASGGSLARALDEKTGGFAAARRTAQEALQRAAATADPRRRLEVARQLAGKGASERGEVGQRFEALALILRDLGLLSAHADARFLANADLEAALGSLGRAYDTERSLRAFSAVGRALAALERNASPKIVADWLVLQL
jgi:DNA polymerase-3 subunit delta'